MNRTHAAKMHKLTSPGVSGTKGVHIPNPKKQQMLREERITEIERQNRLLYAKIMRRTTRIPPFQQEKLNLSLNLHSRKKRQHEIEQQNAMMLARIQNNKSQYSLSLFKKEWKKKKQIKMRIAHHKKININNNIEDDIQFERVLWFGGFELHVSVKLTAKELIIIAYDKQKKEQKVIQIERREAMEYIEEECGGKMERIFDKLEYRGDTLYLMSK